MDDVAYNLKRARLLKNISMQKAGEILNMSSTAIMKYESGVIVPNSKKLIEFAKAYDVSVSDLLKHFDCPQIEFKNFRKKQKIQGKKLDLLQMLIKEKISDYLYVYNLNNFSNEKLIKYKCSSIDDAEEAAIKFREKIGLSNKQPLFNIIDTLENIGIVIIQIDNKIFDGFDGYSEVIDDIPIIVINNYSDDGARERFTIAHELGHLVLDISVNSDSEKICDRFASALLMPKEAVIREFFESRSKISFHEFILFKIEYKVSIAAIIYRLKDLKIISNYYYKQLNILLSKYGYKKNEPYRIEFERSHQFEQLVYKLESSDIISLHKACELLGVSSYEYNNQDYSYRY